MLKPGGQPKQVQKWYSKLTPLVSGAREHLARMAPERLAGRSGCTPGPGDTLGLTFLWQAYTIQTPDFTIRRVSTGQEPSEFTQALILTYLVTADGTPPSGRWIAFRDLPDGMFYAQAFRGYAENRLVRELGVDGAGAFRRGAEALHAARIEIGDAGYAFQVFPRLRLGAVYWLGDEDFASRASVLFEDTGPRYMTTDGLAILGSHLVSAICKSARTT